MSPFLNLGGILDYQSLCEIFRDTFPVGMCAFTRACNPRKLAWARGFVHELFSVLSSVLADRNSGPGSGNSPGHPAANISAGCENYEQDADNCLLGNCHDSVLPGDRADIVKSAESKLRVAPASNERPVSLWGIPTHDLQDCKIFLCFRSQVHAPRSAGKYLCGILGIFGLTEASRACRNRSFEAEHIILPRNRSSPRLTSRELKSD